MFDLIEDVYGAIADIPEHAEGYGTDPTRIVVTGDSAGGHTKKMNIFSSKTAVKIYQCL